MSEWVDIPLAMQQGEERGPLAANGLDSDLINLMLKENPPGSRAPFHIASTPCIAGFFLEGASSGLIRGFIRDHNGTFFMIRGTSVWYVSGSTWTVIPSGGGGGMAGTAICRMVDAGTHVVAVDGTNAIAFTTAAVTACSRGNFSDVAYQDGYTIYTETGTDSLYASNLDDPTTIGALNFTTVDALPGDCVGVISDHREVFAFKQGSIEHYYNSGGSGFPFTRGSPGVIETGCWPTGRLTIAKYGNAIYWVGSDLRVYEMRGYQPVPISSPWAEQFLQTVVAAGVEIYASVFTLDGVSYYVISGFTDPDIAIGSLVCNLRNKQWHRWATLLNDGSNTGVKFISFAELYGDRVLVAANATTSGITYEVRPDLTQDFGESGVHSPQAVTPTQRITLPQISYGDTRAFMYELDVDMQKATASGTTTLTWSDDGGANYSSGITGTATNPRLRFQRLGSFSKRILRLTFSIASKLAITGIRARLEVGE